MRWGQKAESLPSCEVLSLYVYTIFIFKNAEQVPSGEDSKHEQKLLRKQKRERQEWEKREAEAERSFSSVITTIIHVKPTQLGIYAAFLFNKDKGKA